VSLLLHAESMEPRGAGELVEIGALNCYDRPQPSMSNYDELLGNWPTKEVLQ
jgi:hypothetical protein